MNQFWTNIVRYPRFFISSVLGLILIILTPFKTLFKAKKFRFGFISLLFIFVILMFFIIKAMVNL